MATRDELLARVAAAKAAAAKAALNDEEREIAELHAQEQAAIEEEAAAHAARRSILLRERAQAAQEEFGGFVEGVDLVAGFPLGKAPMDIMPADGIIVVRATPPEAENALAREVEAKRRGLHPMMLDVLLASLAYPKPNTPDHLKLQKFADKYPSAATNAAGVARRLAGAKLAEDKRGRG
ncbi:MAG TPA: hypothetical protein VLT47_04435 [Anaeromyxobacteraceae bacterium]|nr:hypothetical protein [Anaeromyxobacteraceae bacterium]